MAGRAGRSPTSVTVVSAAVTTTLLAAWFHVEQRAPDFDPQYARDIVERTRRFGGSYYVNGIHNKGPLEPALYHVAAWFTSYDGFWFGIAVLVMSAAATIGLAVRRVVMLAGGPSWLGWSATAIAFVHLTLSGADYAGVLYSRNMTATLLCLALLGLTGRATERPGRRRLVVCIAAGACLGLAVQTLLTASLSAAVLATFGFLWLGPVRSSRRGSDRTWFVAAAAAAFATAPLYYAVVGPWRAFWDGWWVYGRYMSMATGNSLAEQLGAGWHEWYRWSTTHAPAVGCVVASVVLGWSRRRLLPRRALQLHALALVWWLAAWLEIVLTQRFSTHYFVAPTVPLAMMVALTAWHVVDLLVVSGARLPHPSILVAVLLVGSTIWSGTSTWITGLGEASRFRGIDELAAERQAARSGPSRSVQAVLDLVSAPDDPMLTWTNQPWPYLEFRRVSATRFIWKSFLMGEIYLGKTSTDYVLPGSWDRWTEDVAATNPAVFLLDDAFPVPDGTPARSLLDERFRQVVSAPPLTLALRDDVVSALVAPGSETIDVIATPGWKVDTTSIEFTGATSQSDALRLFLGDMACRRIDFVVERGSGVSFHFDDPSGRSENLEIALVDDVVISRSPNVEFWNARVERGDPVSVSMVAGHDVAVVVVDGTVAGAVNLVETSAVTISNVGDAVSLRDVRQGPAPRSGQCA